MCRCFASQGENKLRKAIKQGDKTITKQLDILTIMRHHSTFLSLLRLERSRLARDSLKLQRKETVLELQKLPKDDSSDENSREPATEPVRSAFERLLLEGVFVRDPLSLPRETVVRSNRTNMSHSAQRHSLPLDARDTLPVVRQSIDASNMSRSSDIIRRHDRSEVIDYTEERLQSDLPPSFRRFRMRKVSQQ